MVSVTRPVAPPVRAVTVPAGLGWPEAWAFTARLRESFGTRRMRATIDLTPQAAFDAVSDARANPGATYYVSASGSDGSGTGTAGSPWRSVWKAIQAANAGGVPAKIVVGAGSYSRDQNPGVIGSPTVDIALVATGGRVVTGARQTTYTFVRDGTYTNCFSMAVAAGTVDRIVDAMRIDRFGNGTDLVNVDTAARCDASPDSWTHIGGTLYVHRRDQRTPTTANTLLLRISSQSIYVTERVNVYVGGETANDSWELQGGGGLGPVHVDMPDGSDVVVAMERVVSRCGGGVVTTGARAFAFNNVPGLVYLSDCRGDAAATDGFNFHADDGATMYALTVNCEAADNGRGTSQSCNSWTTHETVTAIDLAGSYRGSRGGACHSINASTSLLVGTYVESDYGDLMHGGAIPPTAFKTADTAIYWLDRVRADLPMDGYRLSAGSGTAIHTRNLEASSLPNQATGTIDTW